MDATDSKCKPTLGFLTVVEHPQYGLFGGYLILNTAGRPLEFHCTAPIKPNRAQEILYGPTLESFLYGEQIGQTLISQGSTPPLWYAPIENRPWPPGNTSHRRWCWCCRRRLQRGLSRFSSQRKWDCPLRRRPDRSHRTARRVSTVLSARRAAPWRPSTRDLPARTQSPGPARASRRRPATDRRSVGRPGRIVRPRRTVPAHSRCD